MELIAQVWSIIHDPEAVESPSLFVLKSPSKLKFLEMEEISNFSSSSPSLTYMLLHTLVQVSFHPHFMGVQVDKLWEHRHSSLRRIKSSVLKKFFLSCINVWKIIFLQDVICPLSWLPFLVNEFHLSYLEKRMQKMEF